MGNVQETANAYQQQEQQQSGKPPPASVRVLNNLPNVKVTADDLLEETNKECLICLEEQRLGSIACKLPCGHLFHKQCVAEWLQKHCTCPVCRYELETDDSTYENQRQKRMKDRKLRMRIDELKMKSISQLRAICSQFEIDISGCIDKMEIIERIRLSNKVILTEGLPPIEISEEAFLRKNVAELKHLLLSFGLSTEGALEKSELRNRLLESGRVVIVEGVSEIGEENAPSIPSPHSPTMNPSSYSTSTPVSPTSPGPHSPSTPMPQQSSTSPRSNINNSGRSTSTHASSSSSSSRRLYSSVEQRQHLEAMSLGTLRQICREYRIGTQGCIDKSEVVDRIMSSSALDNIMTAYAPAAVPAPATERDRDREWDAEMNNSGSVGNASSRSASAGAASSSSRTAGSDGINAISSRSERTTASVITEEDYIDRDDSRFLLSQDLIDSLPNEELLMILASYQIPIQPSMSREEIQQLLHQCPQIRVV